MGLVSLVHFIVAYAATVSTQNSEVAKTANYTALSSKQIASIWCVRNTYRPKRAKVIIKKHIF